MSLRVKVVGAKGLNAHGLRSAQVSLEVGSVKNKTRVSRSHSWNEEFIFTNVTGAPLVLKVNRPIHLPGTATLMQEVHYNNLVPEELTRITVNFGSGSAVYLELTLSNKNLATPRVGLNRRRSRPSSPSPFASSPPKTMKAVFQNLPDSVQKLPWSEVEACLRDATKIGEGGFGPVYRATLPDGADVAIKLRDPNSMQGVKEFLLEVELVTPLRHPAIVKIIAVASDGENFALIYPFFKKGTLEGVLEDPQLTWESRLHIARDIAEGIGVLHALTPPILHRDISPDNVLLTDDWRAKLADFGTARESPELMQEETVSDEPRGKWHYMAPEVREEGRWGTGSDVYAIGVVLLQLLAATKEPTVNGVHLSMLDLQQLPQNVPWPDLVRRSFYALAQQCFLPKQTRIGSWKLAAEIQEMLAQGLLQQCDSEPSEVGYSRMLSSNDCTWCESRPRSTRLSCGHCVMCEECTKEVVAEIGMCPMCQAFVTGWVPALLSDLNQTYVPFVQ